MNIVHKSCVTPDTMLPTITWINKSRMFYFYFHSLSALFEKQHSIECNCFCVSCNLHFNIRFISFFLLLLHFLCAKMVGAIIIIAIADSYCWFRFIFPVHTSATFSLPPFFLSLSMVLSPTFPFSSCPLPLRRSLRKADYAVLIDVREWLMKYSIEHQLNTQKMYTRRRTILPD